MSTDTGSVFVFISISISGHYLHPGLHGCPSVDTYWLNSCRQWVPLSLAETDYPPGCMGVPPLHFNTVTFQMLLPVTVQGCGVRGGGTMTDGDNPRLSE